jgi:relaxase-like protein
MVAKITFPKSMSRALNYNEKKMKQGKAECIHAGNYLKDADQMTFYQKMERFEKLIELNKRATTNTIHISLNFDPSEKLDKEKLIAIANDYMEKIGFGKQPYLVYIHYDAGHPHIHILSTSIKPDGKRISMHNIGRNQSEAARKDLEKKYGLVKAEGRELKKSMTVNPVNVQKVIYGKSETKRSITNVLDAVIDKYKYTSLAELNAILKQYNVVADMGKEGSRIYKNKGLTFRMLDENGNKVGVPIKASSIYSQPTLKNLEKKFEENKLKRQPDIKQLKNAIDWVMVKPPKSIDEFVKALQKEKIAVVLRRSENGKVYGLTYIDYRTKSVFNGSDLGKEYSAKAIVEKCAREIIKQQENKSQTPKQHSSAENEKQKYSLDYDFQKAHANDFDLNLEKAIELVMRPIDEYDQIPYELKKEQERKKKRHST